MINKRYSGVDGEKNLRMDLKMVNIMKYFLLIFLVATLVDSQENVISDLTIDNKTVYFLSIILSIVSISLNVIVDKIKNMNILRFLNAIIIFINMLIIISGVTMFIFPLLFVAHIALIYIYTKKSKTREKITEKMNNNKAINSLPRAAILFSLFIVSSINVSVDFEIFLMYLGMVVAEIAYLDIINLNVDALKKYKLTKYYK
ncbi:MAG: hypothetical protein ACK5HR_07415 [Mycoplasmatales bacterium]